MNDLSESGLFRTVGTYLGVPQSLDLSDAKAAIVGLPFDSGRHPRRVGARLGPAAIRAMSTDMVRRFRMQGSRPLDPVAALGLVDCGDVALTSAEIDDAMDKIAAAVSGVLAAGTIPICLGGDGVISLPQMKALSERYPDLVVLHFDSHTDAYPEGGNDIAINPATTFSYAADQGWVDAAHSVHFGLRGTAYVPGVFDYTRAFGYHVMPIETLDELGVAGVTARFREVIGGRPVFLCFDMDVFDPSVAPGVFTPSWGGLSAREGLGLIRGLEGLNIVGYDINTTTPPFDVQGMTAWLAATVALEFCYLACASLGIEPQDAPSY